MASAWLTPLPQLTEHLAEATGRLPVDDDDGGSGLAVFDDLPDGPRVHRPAVHEHVDAVADTVALHQPR